VQVLRGVQILVIDEISTTGAAQFEIISRRLEQVGKVLWRELHGQNLPSETLDGFGGLGVLLIGDFAQLPPVLSSSLLPQAAIEERKTSGKRSLALDGRKSFGRFEKVIRLRRIHRLLGKDPFKDSTLRLRDAAVSINDYALWKTHELPSLDEHDSAPWEGAEDLLSTALVLVTDNAQAGRVNGKRLAEGVPLFVVGAEARPCRQWARGGAMRCETQQPQGMQFGRQRVSQSSNGYTSPCRCSCHPDNQQNLGHRHRSTGSHEWGSRCSRWHHVCP
jgi:hypothetical protein